MVQELGRPRSFHHSVMSPSFICLKATKNGVSAATVFALKEVVDNKGVVISDGSTEVNYYVGRKPGTSLLAKGREEFLRGLERLSLGVTVADLVMQ